MTRLQAHYQQEIIPTLTEEFGFTNFFEVPRLSKISVNIGLGEAVQNIKALDAAMRDLATITGQQPVVARAKKSEAGFKLREGMPIGAFVTLRRARMYEFLDRLINFTLPRVRDFRGVSPRAFDGRGNYNLGIREQIVFPEIKVDKIDRIRGLNIAIVTTARTDEEGRRLLRHLGMPFRQ